MDQSFDLMAHLRTNETGTKCKTNKCKPAQFSSVAEGTAKRRQTTVKARKSTRLTVFDTYRALEQYHSPPPKPLRQIKHEQQEHRRQQLERWKEEKELKKKQEAAQKKKPFLAGASKYIAPPKPATTGVVTRSRAQAQAKDAKPDYTKSFAPSNARFNAPKLKNVNKIPTLRVTKPIKKDFVISFEPVMPNNEKTTRSNTTQATSKGTKKVATKSSQPSNSVRSTRNAKAIPSTSNSNIDLNTKKTATQARPKKPQITAAKNTQPEKPQVATTKQTQRQTTKPPIKTKLDSSSTSQTEPQNIKRNLRNAKVAEFTQPSSSSSDIELSKMKRISPFPKPQPKLSKVSKSSSSSVESNSSYEQLNLRRKSFRQAVSDNTVSSDSMEEQTVIPCIVLDSTNSIVEVSSREPTLEAVSNTETEMMSTVNLLEKPTPEIVVEKPAPEKLLENFSPENVLEKNASEMEKPATENLLEKSASEYLERSGQNLSTPENLTENSPVFKPVSSHICTQNAKMMPLSESGSEEKLRTSDSYAVVYPVRKSKSECPLTPEQMEEVLKISPRVTLSRGKSNARKEMVWKYHEGLMDDDACDMDNVNHFRKQLGSELARLTELCAHWEQIAQQTTLPEFVQDLILSAVGQARLLMSKKLQQFSKLVDQCEHPEPGHKLVTPTDLHGFWDMVFMQVEDVNIRFKTLDRLQVRDWREDSPPTMPQLPPTKTAAVNKSAGKKRANLPATSRLRAMITAARKAKKNPQSAPPASPGPEPEEKHFEAGFFSIRSPVRLQVPHTPQSGKLYKSVLSSEAKKASRASVARNSASFAMLRASMISKDVEEGFGLLPVKTPEKPLPVSETPIRSILKSTNKSHNKTNKSSARKTCKLVLFNDTHAELNKENTFVIEKSPINKGLKEYNEIIDTNTQKETDIEQTDSGTSSMELENGTEKISTPKASGKKSTPKTKSEKRSAPKTKKITRQNAMDISLIAEDTKTTEIVPRRVTRARKSAPETEDETKTAEEFNGRVTRSRKSAQAL